MSFLSGKPTDDDMKRAVEMAAEWQAKPQPEDSLAIALLKEKVKDLEASRDFAEDAAKMALARAQNRLDEAMCYSAQRAELLRDIDRLMKGGAA